MRALSSLIQGVRDWIGEPDDVYPFTDTFITRQLNRSQNELALKVLYQDPFFYFSATPDTITTTAGTYLYDMPDDYWKTYGIRNSEYVYLNVANRAATDYSTSNQETDGTHFAFIGNQIQIEPPPKSTGTTYYHEYFRVPTDMSDSTDTPDFPAGYEDILELNTALMCGISDGARITDVRARLRERTDDMMKSLSEKQTRQPPHATFVKRTFGTRYPNTKTRR